MNLGLKLKHKQAMREAPSVASQSPLAPYFPNGGVAAPPFMIVNPVSHSTGTAPGNGTPNDLVGPPIAEWIILRSSDEQGRGVPAFKRWPRQFHNEAYNFSTLGIMPFPDQAMPVPSELVVDGVFAEQLANNHAQRRTRSGWSAPSFGEQYEQPIGAAGLGTGPANLRDPQTMAYAIGWGYVGS